MTPSRDDRLSIVRSGLTMDRSTGDGAGGEIRAHFFAGAMEQAADDEVARVLASCTARLEHIRMLEERGARHVER
jgi:hypothetical protein